MMTQKIRTYTELLTIPDYISRYNYLRIGGTVGEQTFGWERYINQKFYRSEEWKRFRREIILRDNGCDLADPGHEFAQGEQIIIHHMNPINVMDIVHDSDYLMNPEYVICCRDRTHKAIHYGDESLLTPYEFVARTPNDTCPWR
jgi:hypothetical protein